MCRTTDRRHAAMRRHGLTLVELLVASTLMVLIAGSLAALSNAVYSGTQYTSSRNTALQHARVCLDRMQQTLEKAYCTGTYPGLMVVHQQVGSYRFPDTLVVWCPKGTPANVNGPPLVREVVIFCPDPQNPRKLLEITAPTDNRSIPLDDTLNLEPWRSQLESLKTSSSSVRIELTDQLRLAAATSSSTMPTSGSGLRAAVRFERELKPSVSAWNSYTAGTLAFTDLPWVQGLNGSQMGLRQVWLRTELQLASDPPVSLQEDSASLAIPFFSSFALYYGMNP